MGFTVEIIDSIIYRRILPLVENRLNASQTACGRGSSAEIRLTETMGYLNRPLLRGRYCFPGLVDIAGGRDDVSHGKLMLGLERVGIDPLTTQIIDNWLPIKKSKVRMATPAGESRSNLFPINK